MDARNRDGADFDSGGTSIDDRVLRLGQRIRRGQCAVPVVYVKAEKVEDLEQYKGKLKGAIVITSEPLPLPAPDEPAINPVLVPYGDSFLLVRPLRPGEKPREFNATFRRFLMERNEFFKKEGVLAGLTDSGKPDGLLEHDGPGRTAVCDRADSGGVRDVRRL